MRVVKRLSSVDVLAVLGALGALTLLGALVALVVLSVAGYAGDAPDLSEYDKRRGDGASAVCVRQHSTADRWYCNRWRVTLPDGTTYLRDMVGA